MLSLPSSVSLVTKNDLIDILEINNPFAQASVSLWGGHILSFTPKHDGRERLFLSEKALFDGSKSIRGGVPLCWPWFGSRDDGLQSHGYIRTRRWSLISVKDEADYTELVLQPDSTTGIGFDGEAALRLTIQCGRKMRIHLSTTNIGKTPFTYNTALHTYFSVENIAQVRLMGLSGNYSDKVRNWKRFETPEPYLFTEETDRIHLNPVSKVSIEQPDSVTGIESIGHDSWVVWNPWSDMSMKMNDMADSDYQRMLCVETAITQGKQVKSGETHCLIQLIS